MKNTEQNKLKEAITTKIIFITKQKPILFGSFHVTAPVLIVPHKLTMAFLTSLLIVTHFNLCLR